MMKAELAEHALSEAKACQQLTPLQVYYSQILLYDFRSKILEPCVQKLLDSYLCALDYYLACNNALPNIHFLLAE